MSSMSIIYLQQEQEQKVCFTIILLPTRKASNTLHTKQFKSVLRVGCKGFWCITLRVIRSLSIVWYSNVQMLCSVVFRLFDD
jgi:hypothetical protein